MGNARRLVNSVFMSFCLLYFICPLTVDASTKKPVVRPSTASDVFVKSGTTLDINRHWGEVIDVKPTQTTLQVVNKSKYGWARVKNIAKFVIKANPARYIATAAVVYAIDKIPGATVVNGVPYAAAVPAGTQTVRWGLSSGGSRCGSSTYCATATEEADKYVQWYNSANSPIGYSIRLNTIESITPSGATAVFDTKQGSQSWSLRAQNLLLVTAAFCDGIKGVCQTGSLPVPFSDSNYDSLVNALPDAPQSAWDEFGPMLLDDVPASFDGPDGSEFTGPPSFQGQPSVTTSSRTNPDGSTTTDLSENTTNYNFDYGTNPLSITTTTTNTTNNYTNGTHTGTTVVTDASSTPAEQPKEKIDCEFMPTHCSWLEWTKKEETNPEKVPLPVEDLENKSPVNVGVGASCPAPVVIDGNGIQGWTTFSIKFDVVCDFMTTIRPIIEGVCLVIAALILVYKP